MAILKLYTNANAKQKDFTDLSGLEQLKLVNSVVDKIATLEDGFNLSNLVDEFPVLRYTLDICKKDNPNKMDIEVIFSLLRKAERKGTKDVTTSIVADQEGYQYLRFDYTNKWTSNTFHWVRGWGDEYYVVIRTKQKDYHIFTKPTGEIRIIRKAK